MCEFYFEICEEFFGSFFVGCFDCLVDEYLYVWIVGSCNDDVFGEGFDVYGEVGFGGKGFIDYVVDDGSRG